MMSVLPMRTCSGPAKRARRIMAQNLAWAVGYNALAIAAAGLGLLHPLLAAVAMAASSLTLLANSLRLRKPVA